ncbi:MAG: hypothetical protein RL104_577 [Bacteroidota bacterium]
MYRDSFRIPQAFLWILAITGGSTLVMMIAVASQDGWNSEALIAAVLVTGIQAFTAWLIRRPCRIQVAESGIDISYRPFNLGPKHVDWNDVVQINHRKVDPMGDFMGYGVRMTGWKRADRVIAYAFEEGRYAFFVRKNAPSFGFQITQPEAWEAVLEHAAARGIEVLR